MTYSNLTRGFATAALPAIFLAAPVHAEVPQPVRDMIDAAIATGDAGKVATVIELAKVTNPADSAEIEAMAAAFAVKQQILAASTAAEKEEALGAAGLFDNWSGEGQIGGFRSTGNSSNTGLTAGLKLKRTGISWRHKLTALADFQRTNGVTTREQFLLGYEPNYQINKQIFVYALSQYERDRFQGFSSRLSASAGIGYDVIDSDRITLSVKAGPAYRKTSFIAGSSDSSIAGLAALDFEWKIGERLKLTQDASAFFQAGNSTFISATGLEASLGSSLSARVSYTAEHDTDPPAGAVQTDTLTRFTLIYGF